MLRWLSVVLAIAAAVWACEVTTPGLDEAVPENSTCVTADAGDGSASSTSVGPGPSCMTAP